MTRMVRVYCAGKIRKCNDWRPDTVRGAYYNEEWTQVNEHGVQLDDKVDGVTLLYVGPFAYACDHGCSHGPTSHGNGLDAKHFTTCQEAIENSPGWCGSYHEGWPSVRPVSFRVGSRSWLDATATEETIRAAEASGTETRCAHCFLDLSACQCSRRIVYDRSLRQIDRADLVIARPEVDSFGTLIEIGYAAKSGKSIVVDLHGQPTDLSAELWFAAHAHRCVDPVLEDVAKAILGYGPEQWGAHARPANRPDPNEVLCDSPIEVSLYRAMRSLGLQPTPQVAIGRYRADFVLDRLVVECDGHDSHSSREQRTHDAARDRTLTAAGYRVIRFTGTEIHRDAIACAREVQRLAHTGASQ